MEVIMRKHIKNNVSWVGKIDWELQEFHGSDYTISSYVTMAKWITAAPCLL